MPLLNNQKRKENFIGDIGKMITGNSVFGQGNKNPDYIKTFKEAKSYFEKQKNPECDKLAGYIQNFINACEEQKLCEGEDLNNEHSSKMMANISAMSKEFTNAYNGYINTNKYTALKNRNVKVLSGIVQVAEDMNHRMEMEDRAETIEYVGAQLANESKIRNELGNELKDYIRSAGLDKVDFVDPSNQVMEYSAKLKIANSEVYHYEKLLKDIAEDKNNTREQDTIDKCTGELLNHDAKLKAAENKIHAISDIKNAFRHFKDESGIINEQIQGYKDEIATNNDVIQQTKQLLLAEEEIVKNINQLRQKKAVLESEDINNTHSYVETNYENAKKGLKELNDMANDNVDIHSLYSKKNPTRIDKIMLRSYEEMKSSLCSDDPDLEARFNELESTPAMAGKNPIKEFMKANNDMLVNAVNTKKAALRDLENLPEYKEYKDICNKVSQAEAGGNRIKALKNKLAECENNIKLNENLIAEAKLKSGLGKQMKDAFGYIPEGKVTEKQLNEILDNEYSKAQSNLENIRKSPMPQVWKSAIEDAKKKIEDKDAVKVNAKLANARVKQTEIKEKLDKINPYVKRYNDLKAKSDKLVNARKEIKGSNKHIDKVSPNEEIYNRLNAIRERFSQKSNGKMNPECKEMMDQLGKTIELFAPGEENTYRHEEQKNALDSLGNLSGKYIGAKKAQHIPNWLASEQRLLRLSVAEELQNFSKTAGAMVNDVQAFDRKFDNAVNYSISPADEKMKDRRIDMDMQKAARESKNLSSYEKYSKAMRERKIPETRTVQNKENTMEMASALQ